jgi:hypothetical protein
MEITMKEKSSAASSGIGFTGLLTILFVGLKLTGFIDWSWWWVLAPSWIPLALVLLIFAGMGLFILVVRLMTPKRWRS